MTPNMAEARREDDPAGPQSQCDELTPKSTGHVGHTPTGGMLAAALELATLTEERLRQLHASRAAAFTAEHTYQARGRWRGALYTMSDPVRAGDILPRGDDEDMRDWLERLREAAAKERSGR